MSKQFTAHVHCTALDTRHCGLKTSRHVLPRGAIRKISPAHTIEVYSPTCIFDTYTTATICQARVLLEEFHCLTHLQSMQVVPVMLRYRVRVGVSFATNGNIKMRRTNQDKQ